jgi:hypothetical protein
MAAVRQIYKKRVGPEGVEIDCGEDAERWVDIKETKKAKYEQGKGRVYRKTIYQHCNESEKREYDVDPADKITFKNPEAEDPEDEDQQIPYLKSKGPNHGTIKRLWIEAGKGAHYQKTRLQYCNTEDGNKRKIREQRVENEQTGDYIMVERIERWENEWGKGRVYQKKRTVPCSTEEQIRDMEGDCKEIT